MFRADFFERLSLPAVPWLGRRSVDATAVALTCCVLVGMWLRTRGMFGEETIPFWYDEAAWAIRLKRDALTSHLIRPLGFMAVSKFMARTFGASEAALRFLPWAASIGTLLLSVRLGRQLFKRRAGQLLFVAILALHPDVIDLGKEYKHYSVALFVHVLLASLALTYARSRDWFSLRSALAATVLSIFFAQDAVFAYPGVYLVLAWSAFDARRSQHLVATTLAAGLSVTVLVALYWFFWRHVNAGGGEETAYWGHKYDVFYMPSETEGPRWRWLAEKYRDLAAFPGTRRDSWTANALISSSTLPALRSMDALVWVALHAVGVGVIVVRRLRNEGLLLVLPFLVLTMFNVLGFWPFGVFRTNLFAIVYAAAIATFAVSPTWERGPELRALVPTLALVVAPLLAFERGWHGRKSSQFTTQTAFPAAFRALIAGAASRPGARQELLVLDSSSCGIWKYYVRQHPVYRKDFQHLRSRFRVVCTWRDASPVDLARTELRRHQRAWFLILDQEGVDRFRSSSMARLRVVSEVAPAMHTLVVSVRRTR